MSTAIGLQIINGRVYDISNHAFRSVVAVLPAKYVERALALAKQSDVIAISFLS